MVGCIPGDGPENAERLARDRRQNAERLGGINLWQ
jgi:hypothetical protein